MNRRQHTGLGEQPTTKGTDNLQQHLQNHLDDGTLVDEYEEFFVQMVALLPEAVAVLQDAGFYRPIALNPIASLAGSTSSTSSASKK